MSETRSPCFSRSAREVGSAWKYRAEEQGAAVTRKPSKPLTVDPKSSEWGVITLNLGGRNTNPLEFILDGDDSLAGQAGTQARLRAQEAMVPAPPLA